MLPCRYKLGHIRHIVAVVVLLMSYVKGIVEQETNIDCPKTLRPEFIHSGLKWPMGTPNRSDLTVPDGFSLAPSVLQGAGLGILAKVFVPKYTWLGEYEGEFVAAGELDDRDSDYAWDIYRTYEDNTIDTDDVIYYVDARDKESSNWLRYVNCARHLLEENVDSVQCYGRRYYLTTRDIAPGQELLTYYGRSYAHRLGIDDDEYYNKEFWLYGKRSHKNEEEEEEEW